MQILTVARTIGLVSGSYQWLSGDGWSFGAIESRIEFSDELIGTLGVSEYTNKSTAEYQDYAKKFQQQQLALYNRNKTAPAAFTIGYYDSMIMFAKALNRTAARLKTLSISIECLRYSMIDRADCKLPTSERDAIYADAVSQNYVGVVEYMKLIPDSSIASKDVLFGVHSQSVYGMVLQELYRTSYQGALHYLQLTPFGDNEGVYAVFNLQPSNGEEEGKKLRWVVAGIGDSKNGTKIDFEKRESNIIYSGSTATSLVTDPSLFQTKPPVDWCNVADKPEFSFSKMLHMPWQSILPGWL